MLLQHTQRSDNWHEGMILVTSATLKNPEAALMCTVLECASLCIGVLCVT
jgi:hypothetical protein